MMKCKRYGQLLLAFCITSTTFLPIAKAHQNASIVQNDERDKQVSVAAQKSDGDGRPSAENNTSVREKNKKSDDGAHLLGSLKRATRALGRYCKNIVTGIWGLAWGLEGGFKEHGKRRLLSGVGAGIIAAKVYVMTQAAPAAPVAPAEDGPGPEAPQSDDGPGVEPEQKENEEQKNFEFSEIPICVAAKQSPEGGQRESLNSVLDDEPKWWSEQSWKKYQRQVYWSAGMALWNKNFSDEKLAQFDDARRQHVIELQNLAKEGDERRERERQWAARRQREDAQLFARTGAVPASRPAGSARERSNERRENEERGIVGRLTAAIPFSTQKSVKRSEQNADK